ncbi:MAG TPA: glycosyltransferase [Candidatus Saccharimonadales bacterium]|nr:glycosyltransferase [Candidatus Saccharimonadales bacterium]
MAAKRFSIILPTYSGLATLPQTLASILAQDLSSINCELIVVIDGPSKQLKDLVESRRNELEAKKIDLSLVQFKKNKGRFEARVAGAETAKHGQLLFLEDRVFLEDNYFSKLASLDQRLMLSNVIEAKSKSNLIADSLSSVRKLVYGASWGQDFEDYLITADNFEKSPKGLASLWVPKDDFLGACEQFAKDRHATRDSSDDTGVLRLLIENTGPIYRTSHLRIYYQPRTGLGESVKHLFERGPKFVDYYKKPGTKFFPVLAGVYVGMVVLVGALVLKPIWVLWGLIAFLLMVLLLASRTASTIVEGLRITIGLPLVILIFVGGILKGTLQALAKR